MEPIYFASAAGFRAWLEEHHETDAELIVGFYKKASGVPSITWPEAVDEALCFGWIDSVRRTVDEDRYTNRFTPRKRSSNWSAVNVRKVAALTKEGRMHPAGLRAYEARSESRTGVYSFEQGQEPKLTRHQQRTFRADPEAWAFFSSTPPSYRWAATWWVISAKQQPTRDRRLQQLIEDSGAGRRIRQLTRPSDR
jgi:uncharacterized protein YdeI (YjbR/CyaY-like superfamily)